MKTMATFVACYMSAEKTAIRMKLNTIFTLQSDKEKEREQKRKKKSEKEKNIVILVPTISSTYISTWTKTIYL